MAFFNFSLIMLLYGAGEDFWGRLASRVSMVAVFRVIYTTSRNCQYLQPFYFTTVELSTSRI